MILGAPPPPLFTLLTPMIHKHFPFVHNYVFCLITLPIINLCLLLKIKKFKSMQANTPHNDNFLHILQLILTTNSYRRPMFSCTTPTVWNKLSFHILNPPSVVSFMKQFENALVSDSLNSTRLLRHVSAGCLARKSDNVCCLNFISKLIERITLKQLLVDLTIVTLYHIPL